MRITPFKYVLLLAFGVCTAALAIGAQQPSEQGPPPATCEQAQRENAAYRDRIASLERQIDATNEEAKTFYMRAEFLTDLAADQDRLISRYRELNVREAARVDDLRRELVEVRAALERERRRGARRAGR
jgi:hypothetical protein